MVGRSVDVWSLGCVFSEVATWLAHGWQFLKEYRQQRHYELRMKLGSDTGDLFHDGVRVLNTVRDTHNGLQGTSRKDDHVSQDVVALITDMMDTSDCRLNSVQAYQKSMKIIERAVARMAPTRDLSNKPSDGSAKTLIDKTSIFENLERDSYEPPESSLQDRYESPADISQV